MDSQKQPSGILQPRPKFSISIVVHNLVETTKRCLESIARTSQNCELLITDNASTDGTADYLSSIAGINIRVITNSANLGFSGPHNHALTLARGKYFIVLNNDVVVPTGWLDALEQKFVENANLAIAGARGQCNSLDPSGMGFPGGRVEYVEGSCLMIPTELASKHGLFSEGYRFAYYEDSDLSLRLREKGFDIAIAETWIQHERAKTADFVKAEIDLEGYKSLNRAVFQSRWKRYLAERTFSREVLVIRDAAMGDALLVTPVLRSLKQKWPAARITVATQCPEVFARNPNVDRIGKRENLPASGFDHVYDLNLAYERSPHRHIIDSYAVACEVSSYGYVPEVFPSVEDAHFGAEWIPGGTKIAVISPGPTAWVGRNWPLQHFRNVVEVLKERGYFTILVGFLGENTLPCDLDLRSKTTIHQLYAILKKAALYVGIDSLPMHLAVAADIPIVAVFGCIMPVFRLPPGQSYMRGAVARNVGCLGCHHSLPAPRTSSECLRPEVFCMTRLLPSEVLQETDIAIAHYAELHSEVRDGRVQQSIL